MTRVERFLACAVAAAALASGWPSLDSGYEGPYDEGNTLCAAARALAGEVPCRDFWSLRPPGTTWLLAGAFRVFGATLGVERAVKTGVVALAAVLLFLLARLAARPEWAAAAALAFAVLPTQTLSLRSRDTGLVLVLATLLAVCSPAGRPRRRALIAGLLAGSTAWFKQDFAAVAALAGGAALALPAFRGAPAGRKVRTVVRDALAPFAGGLAVAPLALAATLAATGSLAEFVRQAVVFPALSFERVRGIPLGFRLGQLVDALGPGSSVRSVLDAAAVPVLYGAALAAGLAAAVAGAVAIRRGADVRGAATLGAGLAAALMVDIQRVRTSLEHANPALALGLVALAGFAASREAADRSRSRALAGAAVFALVAAVLLPAAVRRARDVKRWAVSRPEDGLTSLPAARRWIALPEDVARTARFVAASTAAGEGIFVGNARHDVLAYDAPLLYFLSGRPGATRYDNLHPGVATTKPVQEEIVRSLEAAGTRLAILWDGPPPGEPNESSRPVGAVVLDEWLARHGREVARFGAFRVLRTDGPPERPTPSR